MKGPWSLEEDRYLFHWIFEDITDKLAYSIENFRGRNKRDVENRIQDFKNAIDEKIFMNPIIEEIKLQYPKRGRQKKSVHITINKPTITPNPKNASKKHVHPHQLSF
jgi:hypothetical protein